MDNSLESIICALPSRLNIHSQYDYFKRIKDLYKVKSVNSRRQAANMFLALNAKDKLFFYNECDCSEQLKIFLIQQTEGVKL